jgi:hypothetical protein
MPQNIEKIDLWLDNPDQSRISNVVKIDFKFPCTWTILDLADLKLIIEKWIEGEEMKYPLDKDVGLHKGDERGRWMLYKFIKDIFDNHNLKLREETKNGN